MVLEPGESVAPWQLNHEAWHTAAPIGGFQMNKQSFPQTLTVGDIRQILQLGSNSAYNLIHSKAFPVKRVGKTCWIPAEPFYQWLEEQSLGHAVTKS